MVSSRRILLPSPANPGASASATVYDTGDPLSKNRSPNAQQRKRCRVACYLDVTNAKLTVKWTSPGSTNLHTVAEMSIDNGGSPAAAGFFQRDVLLEPGRTVITIDTTTDPSTWEVGAELVDDQALAELG